MAVSFLLADGQADGCLPGFWVKNIADGNKRVETGKDNYVFFGIARGECQYKNKNDSIILICYN
jgi:hypothetical protein